MSTLSDELARRLGISKEAFEARAAEKKREGALAARRDAEQRAATEHLLRAPRYPGAQPMTLAEARALLAKVPPLPANPAVDGLFDPETFTLPSVQWIDGAVELDELHLPAGGSNLIVAGALTVRGTLKQDFRAGGLLVLGDLRARHLVTTAELACTGDLTVDGVLFGNCTNYATNVWGKARAQVLISAKEHAFCFWGGHLAECTVDVEGGAPNLGGGQYTAATMHEVLDPDFGDGRDEAQVSALLRRRDTALR